MCLFSYTVFVCFNLRIFQESKSLPPVVHSNREDAELQLVETTEALKRSEERNLQLVRVTQEWAEECRESENMVASLQRQLKALEGERDTLLTKYSRAKHMLSAGGGGSGGGGGGGGVGRGQFEEMRNEMSERKGINDKVTIASWQTHTYAHTHAHTCTRMHILMHTHMHI